MKNFFLILFCALITFDITAQASFDALKYSPATPQINQELEFTYNQRYSKLINQPKAEILVYFLQHSGIKVMEPAIVSKAMIFKGKVKIEPGTSGIVFLISSGEMKDNNKGKGYVIPVYDEKNNPVEDFYSQLASLQNGFQNSLFEIDVEPAVALQTMEEGLKKHPNLKTVPAFLNNYLSIIKRAGKADAGSVIATKLAEFESSAPESEEKTNLLLKWYREIKNNEKAESLAAKVKASGPVADLQKAEDMKGFSALKTAGEKEALLLEFLKKYPPSEKDKVLVNGYKSQLAKSWASEKNYEKFHQWNDQLEGPARASNNNAIAWKLAESGENLAEAKKMSKAAADYAKKEIASPSGIKPPALTNKQWLQQREQTFAMYGDTYAYTLLKLGEYETALPIAREAARINDFKDAELNEHLALIAEKSLKEKDTRKLIEDFVKAGTASTGAKEILKRLFVADKKTEDGYEEYLAKLSAVAKMKKRAEIERSILDEPAPKFSLTDFEGKAVSLEDLKGKIVIVDFWATWCGPCIASMPGMNKALEKYKDNKEVSFLFVDTWERVTDKLSNAKDFMKKKNYPFYVLMDNDNSVVESYKVPGIPTKFVIDKKGRIRFKTIGYEGDEDALVEELTAMIEIAGK